MTTLWKLEAVHELGEGSFCRLFRSDEDAAVASVPLALHGWWLDIERLAWPTLDPLTIDRAVTAVWPILDDEMLLRLVAGPPLLERDLALECLRFETADQTSLNKRRSKLVEQVAASIDRLKRGAIKTKRHAAAT